MTGRSRRKTRDSKGAPSGARAFGHEIVACGYGQVPRPVGFLFIDVDHSLESNRRDWEAWAPTINLDRGTVALHDSSPSANSPPTLGSQKLDSDVIEKDLLADQIGRLR